VCERAVARIMQDYYLCILLRLEWKYLKLLECLFPITAALRFCYIRWSIVLRQQGDPMLDVKNSPKTQPNPYFVEF
jgi:hypothetical protein